ncbi:MAG: hypothetical protein ACRCXZ_10150 [Patescibacteria group bacterium]
MQPLNYASRMYPSFFFVRKAKWIDAVLSTLFGGICEVKGEKYSIILMFAGRSYLVDECSVDFNYLERLIANFKGLNPGKEEGIIELEEKVYTFFEKSPNGWVSTYLSHNPSYYDRCLEQSE